MKKIHFISLLSFLIILIINFHKTIAQEKVTKSIITGQIIDYISKLPLESVNVFFDNTTIGDVSDKNGKYSISNIHPGAYTLVVSMIGYEVVETNINIISQKEIIQNFHLKPKILQFQPLEITAETPNDWKKNLERFKKLFLGSSQFARHCEILNPEVLDFSKGTSNSFFAVAEATLLIENHDLGYKIRFILDRFRADANELAYSGQTQFVEMASKNDNDRLKWNKNRQIAYLGSPRHFLVSLLNEKEESEGFIIYQLVADDKEKMKNRPSRIIKFPIKVKNGMLPFERYVCFPGILKVEYTKEHIDDDYLQGENQVSWIELTDSMVIVDLNGNLLYQQAIKNFGYWGQKRVGDLLPMDYKPGPSLLFYSDHTPNIDLLKKQIESKANNEINEGIVVAALDELTLKNYDHEILIKQLYKDIIDIINIEETKKWKELKTNKQKAKFLRRFWLLRDMSFGTKKNERLEEHYNRLNFAKTIYSALTTTGYDDRGRIYVKYGSPNVKQNDVMPNYQSVDFPGIIVAGKSLETWVYSLTGNQIIFNFVDNGWGYSLAYSAEDILPRRMEREAERRLIAISEILRTRFDLDVRFSFAYMLINDVENYYKVEGAFDSILKEQLIAHRKIPFSISKIFNNISKFNFSMKPALFKNNKYENALILAYGFREDDIKFQKSDARSNQQIQIQTVIRDLNVNDITIKESTIPLKTAKFDKNKELIHQVQIPIVENEFYILADVSNPLGKQKDFRDYSIRSSRDTTQQLHLSSVIFAKEIVPVNTLKESKKNSQLIRNDLAIKMYPFYELRAKEPISIYFEIYGLCQNDSGDTQYKIEYTVNPIKKKGFMNFLSNLNPFKKDKGKISISYSQEGKKINDYFSIRLDFSQMSLGNYDLVIRVMDSVATNSKETKTSFMLK